MEREATTSKNIYAGSIVFLVATMLSASTSEAQPVFFPTNCLLPEQGIYSQTGPFQGGTGSGGTTFNLSNFQFFGFSSCLPPPGPGGSTTHTFSSIVEVDLSQNGGTPFHVTAPATSTVRVDFNSQVGNTRFFDTEMLQLDISGGNLPPGELVREDPTRSSLGFTTITSIPGGGFDITSFFNVCTQVFKAGQFISSDNCGRVDLAAVPEPSTLLLLGSGLAGIAAFGRRRLAKKA